MNPLTDGVRKATTGSIAPSVLMIAAGLLATGAPMIAGISMLFSGLTRLMLSVAMRRMST